MTEVFFSIILFYFLASVVLLAKMPIASGATGRVDVGVDSNKRWAPDGLKRNAQPLFHHYDSYLLRHQELKQMQKKDNMLKEKTVPNDHENEGAKEEFPQENGCIDDDTSGPASRRKSSKTSRLCVVM